MNDMCSQTITCFNSVLSFFSPLYEYMTYKGNRTAEQQETTSKLVQHLFSADSFMANLLIESFKVASYDKIIPQFGTDSSYYSVLEYLLRNREKTGVENLSLTQSSFEKAFKQ